ncbi:MAG: peptide chain release factor N(5)-glutamine methyltransferase [Lentisphaeria bacterium]|nr:peptide chain release factor N(5)-glutamine methyltransferase [Lentisphaeria bacterium]
MTPKELVGIFERDFAAAGVETPRADALRLVSETAGIPALEMELGPGPELAPGTETLLRRLAARRCRREPLQYLTGRACFRDLELRVSPAVLIPRPETELLVDILLLSLPRNGRLLDLGTGSGAIAIAAATERPDIDVTAVDVSPGALEVARSNARQCGAKIRFLESDLFSAVENETFDFVAANLPYVTEEEYETLSPEVRDHEPALALVAPGQGLGVIRRAAGALPRHLAPGGKAAFELSPFQAPLLAALFGELGLSARIARDLTGRDRFVIAEKP